jgi:glycosyltransferase involved in cell wall biosynthesis
MSDRINVLHIIQGLFSKGGTPRKLLSLVERRTKEKFHHIFFVYSNQKDNLNDKIIQAGGSLIQVERQKKYDIRLLFDILHVVHKYQVHLINTHFARADLYGTIAGILTGRPVIKNVHGILWNESGCLQKLDGLLSKYRACAVCNSKATQEAVICQTGARNCRVIYNGVPDRTVSLQPGQVAELRASIGIPRGAFVVGHVGGLIPLRDQSIIIDSVSLLVNKLSNILLVFIGDGPIRQQLEDHAASLGVAEKVRFLGYRENVPALMNIFDVYVNMAREEGFGISVVEAMQTGLSVILANSGALPELIEDGVSGILVPPGESEPLAKALLQLRDEPQWAAKIGNAARTRALNMFSIERFTSDFEQLYADLLKGHK